MAFHTLCLLAATIASVTHTHAQTSTVNGRAEYMATAVSTNQYGPPTLIYNCAKLPAICSNVNRRNALTPVGPAPGQWGKLAGNEFIELNYDTNTTRKGIRNRDMCPTSWKRTHACPEPNQPNTVPARSSFGHGSYPPARFVQNGVTVGQGGYNKIANAQGAYSGMIWTCDEWPPASSVEGGRGQAQTYCAPQSAACAGGGVGTRSEQDFQSSAHGALRNRVGNTPDAIGVFTFRFQTKWHDDGDVPATEVQYFEADAGRIDAYQKRATEPTHRVTKMFFSNGTSKTVRRALSDFKIQRRRVTSGHSGEGNKTNITSQTPVHQRFDTLDSSPPLPIFDIARIFINEQDDRPVESYVNQTKEPPLNDKANMAVHHEKRDDLDVGSTTAMMSLNPSLLRARDNAGQCGPGNPCPDGSCCNNNGGCGYGPENCGAGNCTLNCDATALCGKDSAGGKVSCPLNVCCSFYGYCGTDTEFCNSPNVNAPCQKGFGSCNTVSAPSCGGGSANGRSIAYYQVANVRERQCNRITPAQINTTGLTHLNLAFASIDPSSFAVVPGDPADAEIYTEFTQLKSASLKTWVALGGWDFNDPGATQSTWSDLASSQASRASFITSLKRFMAQYGFQGVDLDWEYPGAPDRDGKPEDKQNFVSLLKEMRASFGTDYGISATLPSSYWYLRWFDPQAMEPYVDFFGLMTYDLHGPWDAKVKQIGQTVLGQTNIPEIYNWTLPLWYDKVDPSKINMGLAYYGRGYTLADPNCNHVGCKWSGPSRPGPCTDFGGVMSLQEIQNLIPQIGVQPTLLADDMMKQLTWSDQWIGYDDLETINMKKQWAGQHCFGGTMVWSVDLYSGSGSGDTPDGNGMSGSGDPGHASGQSGSSDDGSGAVVYIDPSIWTKPNPEINCRPPCVFVLPPRVLSSTTTITFPPYVTSLDVAWSTKGSWTSIVETTTLTIPPVTTTAIDVWEYTVTDTNSASDVVSSFYVTSSVLPPPFTITDDRNPQSSPGVSILPVVTRTITPPPYPYTFTTPSNNQQTPASSTDPAAAVIFPIVTFKPGPPGPICKSGCGRPCLIFCHHPCLLDCIDGGNDFADPRNPHPPPNHPTPTPTPDPLPTGPPGTDVPPDDPNETDPKDPEEEEEDDQCAFAFDLTPPTFNGGDSPTTPTNPDNHPSIAPPPPPPSPSPPPNPTPPSPNPSTESLHCFNKGAVVGRGDAIKAVTAFCNHYAGQTLDATTSDPSTKHRGLTYPGDCDPVLDTGCYVGIELSVTVTNGCRFTIDEGDAGHECGRIFRETIDKCDQSSTRFKQGGTVTSNCAVWGLDPNYDGNVPLPPLDL